MVRYHSGFNSIGSVITIVVVVLLLGGIGYLARRPLGALYSASKEQVSQLAHTIHPNPTSPTPSAIAIAPILPTAVPSPTPQSTAVVTPQTALSSDTNLPQNGPQSILLIGIALFIGIGVLWENRHYSRARNR